ncbi:uncharacterized protein [Haliotis cracherodii]|uniref:uncharacterized protein isoform X1 n=1 Tax=Haliotis cracherodii TaxID=6455 RepID=UPI0039E8DBF8
MGYKKIYVFAPVVILLLVMCWYRHQSTQNSMSYTDNMTEFPGKIVDESFRKLLNLYQKKLEALQKSNLWSTIPETPTCKKDMNPSSQCVDPECPQDLPERPVVRLQNVLSSMRPEDMTTLKRMSQLEELQVQPTGKRILFVTGASSNHFMESQAMLKNFHEIIPAHFSNYSLRYYDLGLKPTERAQLEKHCKCDVKIFPVQKLDPWMRRLNCYIWKPMIIQANIKAADIVVWLDSSIRLPKEGIGKSVQDVLLQGLTIGGVGGRAPQFIDTRMMNYFNSTPCMYSPFTMIEANFMMFHNDEFVRDAIIAPWATCAVNHNCMCPDNSVLYCNHAINKYGKCHRYDQAAMNMIALQLFGKHVETLRPKNLQYEVKRGDTFPYFNHLDSQFKTKGA